MDKKNTGELIRKARNEKGYTQRELGDLLGVSNKAVSRWETGESFPDIGVLENLSTILELKIQDIVTGKISVENDNNVLAEIVRAVRIQQKERFRHLLLMSGEALVLFYLLLIGYIILSGRSLGNLSVFVCYLLLILADIIIAVRILIEIKAERECSGYDPSGKKTLEIKKLGIVAFVSGVYLFFASVLVMWMVTNNMMPFNMEVSSVGSFLIYQIMAVFLLNLIIVAIILFLDIRGQRGIESSIFVSLGAMHLALLYSDMLHRMDTLESFWRIFIVKTIFVCIISIVAFALVSIYKMKIHRDLQIMSTEKEI